MFQVKEKCNNSVTKEINMKSKRECSIGAVECLLGIMLITAVGCTSPGWEARLDSELPALGHRNWIVIADSAYPKQSAAGIETIYTGEGQLEVLATVLRQLEAAPHIQPIVLLDEEMAHVQEEDAPGMEAYRSQLSEILKGKTVEVMPHEKIIGKLDESAATFNILLLKTDMTIPYTSVFLQLDCGYWGAVQEQKLREAMGGSE